MAKKKNKSKVPTTNKFWAQMVNKTGSATTRQLVDVQKNASKTPVQNMEQVDIKDLTEDNSPANPMAALLSSTSSTVAGNSQQKSDNLAKKKKKSELPTTNKFWVQTVNKTSSVTTRQLVDVQKNASKTPLQNMEQVDTKDLTEDNSPANPMAALSSSTSSTVAGNSQQKYDNLQAVPPVNAPNVYYMQTFKQMNKEESKPVVQGTASDIKLVFQKGTKTATLQTVVQTPKPSVVTVKQAESGKTIQPRITRGPFNTQNTPKTPMQKNVLLPTFLPVAPAPVQTPTFNKFVPNTMFMNFPKGIPKSFLMAPTGATPEPYSNMGDISGNNVTQNVNWIPNTVAPSQNWQADPTFGGNYVGGSGVQTSGQTENHGDNRTYSPSDMYDEKFFTGVVEGTGTGSNDEAESSEGPSAQKRLSAFDRLGPLAEPPKKPKLTINLLCNSEQSVREVVDETEEEKPKYVPVHLREYILSSSDEIVKKFLPFWLWKRNVTTRRIVTARNSKSVMILEKEQMEELYDKDNLFFSLTIKGYPPSWTKEMVLDTLLDELKGKSFIPCFIDFSPTICNFVVIRSRPALLAIHKMGFVIRKDDIELRITIAATDITLNHIDFIPRLVLRKVLFNSYNENSLDISRFTLKEDLSHFIYFPLNYTINQSDIIQIQSIIAWDNLVELNLSHNRITSIDALRLEETTPKLKDLDLSFNFIHHITSLMRLRKLSLRTIKLEGNPLCHDYTDADYYVKVLKAMFTGLVEIDGIKITFKGDMPNFKKYYCPEDARPIVDTFLEIYFRLLDSNDDNRAGLCDLYDENACLSVTYKYKLRYDPLYRSVRSLFNRSRVLEEGDTDSTVGNVEISKLISKWPPIQHDPMTFTVDVLMHEEFLTIFKVIGIMKLTTESLAEDEHMLSFSRTFVLSSDNGCEYKITNEMLYWDFPTPECSRNAFRMSMVKSIKLSTALESPPDEDLKKKLVLIFMQITNLNKRASQRCLEMKYWNLKIALDHFIKLLKLDDLDTLYK